MRIRVVGAVATSFFFGLGGGLASLGEWQYALAWIAVLPIAALAAVFVTPWVVFLGVMACVGSMVHAAAIASKSGAPFRVLHWMPWACLVTNILLALFLKAFAVEAFKIPSSSMYPALEIGDHIFIEKVTKLWRDWQRGDVIVFVYPCDPDRDYVSRLIGLPGDTIEVRCNVVYVNGKAVENKIVAGECTYEDYDERSDHWYEKSCSSYHEQLDGHEWDVFHSEDRPQHDAMWAAGTLKTGDIRDFPQREHAYPPSCRDAFADGGRESERGPGKIVETKPESAGACEPQLHFVVPSDQLFVLGNNRNNSNDSRVWGGVPLANVKGRVRTIWWSRHASRIGAVH
jgi:signal peptidase I